MSSITIKEVADRAGVSIKTVSRVLNREPHVRPALQQQVMSAVEALNYVPNISARALAGARSYLIGLYCDNPSPTYLSQLELGAMSACRRHGCHLLVEHLDRGEPTFWDRAHDVITRARVEGLILSPPLSDDLRLLDAIEAQNVRVVRISPTAEIERTSAVIFDDRGAANAMTRHLIELGHRRIAFVAGPPDHGAAARRESGFLEAMANAGHLIPIEWRDRGDFSFRSGWDVAARLLGSKDRPTAIFAGNDDMALGIMAMAHRMQIDIPDQLTIVGFDDSPMAEVVWPQLTTVRQPVADMAAAAADLLFEQAQDQRAPQRSRRLDFSLIFRGSSASPAAVSPSR